MTSTVTNYSNNINSLYPTPGVDNDTQGFRDNFANIKNALTTAAGEIGYLQNSTAKLNTGTNDFNYKASIYRGVLVGSGDTSYNNSTALTSATVNTINFLQGSHQKHQIDGTGVTLNVSNWPTENIKGSVIVELTNGNLTTSSTVTFTNAGGVLRKDTSISTLPVTLTTSTTTFKVFELWSSDKGATVYLKDLGTYQNV
jgi:hypothetical protein